MFFGKTTRISFVPGATFQDQNQETTTRMHLQRLSSLILVSRICELSVCLYLYLLRSRTNADIFHSGRESVVCLDSFFKALNCLCMHDAAWQVVPLYHTIYKARMLRRTRYEWSFLARSLPYMNKEQFMTEQPVIKTIRLQTV